ncbi:MAG: IS5 family transposase [Sphaerochaetaceae bacterium]|nr:IS5 family transposase [Sphaerochaetaceae bacterium]
MKFGGELNPRNRWVQLAQLIPWDEYEEEYAAKFPSKRGNEAKPFRMALGALLIKEMKNLPDEELVEDIKENPYYQYLLGLESFQDTAPFEASSLVHFRKRITPEMLKEINEKIVKRQLEKDAEDHEDDDTNPSSGSSDGKINESSSDHKGQLLVDATCTPADIRFPTDLSLLNEAREKTEEIIDYLHHPYVSVEKKPRTYREKARKDFLFISRNRRPRKNLIRKGIRKQLQYLRRNLAHTEDMGEREGCFSLPGRMYRNLLVVNEVYRQQNLMYRKNSRSIPSRIVSISQPHVRPIVRGKTNTPVEFKAKVSVSRIEGYAFLETLGWEPYNESTKLKEHVEDYHRRFGYYPQSILADKIYRTRENLRYCKDLGIRLAGPPLGRPPKDDKVYRTMLKESRRDEIDRIPIEGVFGVAKRKYTLDRVRTKLAETSETTIALVVLGLNLKKILRDFFALLRWLFGLHRFRLIFG